MLDCGEVAEQVARRGANIEKNELNQPEKEQQGNRAERDDCGNNLVLGQNRRKATDREIEHAEQQKH